MKRIEYKESRYLVKVPREDSILIYSTYTGSIVELTTKNISKLKEDYNSYLDDGKTSEELNKLIKMGIIVKDDTDEYDLVKKRYLKNYYNKNKLNITILPAERCNLTCDYCFIYKYANKDMSMDVSKSIIDFIKNRIKESDKEKPFFLRINFYGGEPLLRLDLILDVMNKVLDLKKENQSIKLKTTIITNGVLLSKNVFISLIDHKVDDIQITFDGNKTSHDKTRKFNNGEGSFDIILNNLKEIKNISEDRDFFIKIRINFLKYNFNDCFDLVDNLYSIIGYDHKFTIYCRAITNYETTRNTIDKIEDAIYTNNEASKHENDLMNYIFKVFNYSSLDKSALMPRNGWCMEDNDFSFIVGSDGLIYKCDTLIGDKSCAVGNIDTSGKIHYFDNDNPWVKDIFSTGYLKKCQNCNLLPICFGSCKRTVIENREGYCFLNEDIIKNSLLSYISLGKESKKSGNL